MTYICRHIVLVRLTLAVMRHRDQNQIEEERVYLAYTSTVLFITGGSQERNSSRANLEVELIQGKGEMLLIDLFLVILPWYWHLQNAHVFIYYMYI